MAVLQVRELRGLFEWIADRIEKTGGDNICLGIDFYRIPLSLSWFFEPNIVSDGEAFGSFEDEIDLMRKSLLSGNDDLPEVVMERTGYLLLYLAYLAQQASAAETPALDN